jgi:hypothetical protein
MTTGGTEYKAWMKLKGLKVRDVSFFTKLHSNTIYSFLRDESVEDSTAASLLNFQRDFDAGRISLAS